MTTPTEFSDAAVVDLENVKKAFELMGVDMRAWDAGLLRSLHTDPSFITVERFLTDDSGNKYVHRSDPDHYGEIATEKIKIRILTPSEEGDLD